MQIETECFELVIGQVLADSSLDREYLSLCSVTSDHTCSRPKTDLGIISFLVTKLVDLQL